MKKYSKLTPISLFILIITLSLTQAHALETRDPLQEAEKTLTEGLQILDKAHRGIVDDAAVEPIVAQLNEATRLLGEARQHASEGRMSEAEASAKKALSVAEQAKAAAESLSEISAQRAVQQQIVSWSLVPIASLSTTLIATRGYRWYTERERRKLLDMTVRRKEQKEDD